MDDIGMEFQEEKSQLNVGESGVVPTKIGRDDELQPSIPHEDGQVLAGSSIRANKRSNQSFEERHTLPIKRMRMEVEDNANFTPQKTIIDVNYDCLECVFEFLEIRDLVNVAEANTYLKVAAKMVFSRKLRKRLIIIERAKMPPATSEISFYDNAICIRKWVMAAKIIRLFGQSITGIELRILKHTLRNKFFLHINEYCHKTLNTFNVSRFNSLIFSAAKHPFRNVEQFSSLKARMGPGCRNINRLFPRLRQLLIKESDFVDSRNLVHTFPNLNSLTLNFERGPQKNANIDDIKSIAALNPQLQNFGLVSFWNPDYIDCINPRIWEFIHTKLKNLKSIFTTFSIEHFERFEGPPMQLDNVEIFDVICEIGSNITKPIDVFSFKRLKKMSVECNCAKLEMWLDFILAHPTIEELDIWPREDLTYFGNVVGGNLHEKLIKLSQNMKSVSLRKEIFDFDETNTPNNELLQFFEVHQWFSKLSVIFKGYPHQTLPFMDNFCKNIPQIENYKIKKNTILYYPQVDFEKC